MFTFKNPNTPIIASGTTVTRGGVTFTINSRVLQYFYLVTTDDGREFSLLPMNGRGSSFNWAAGVKLVEDLIESESA